MPVETPSLFAQVIQDHLELKQRNSELEGNLPLERYKTEEQARIEETMDGEEPAVSSEIEPLAWPTEQSEPEEGLWSRSRDFDWGD
jgi:hypothetical protein